MKCFLYEIMEDICNSLNGTFFFTLMQEKGVFGSLLSHTTWMASSSGYQLK